MGFTVKKTQGGSRVDAGEYKALIRNYEPGDHPQNGPNLKWDFEIKDPMLDGDELDDEVVLSCFTGQKLTSKTKLNKLLVAAGKDLDEDEEIDMDDVLGTTIRVIVEDDPKDDGNVYSKITSFLKAKGKGKPSSKSSKKKESPKPKEEDQAEENSSGDDDDFDFD